MQLFEPEETLLGSSLKHFLVRCDFGPIQQEYVLPTSRRPSQLSFKQTDLTPMFQPLRLDGSQREDDDVVLYRRLSRDICFLYHELAEYGYIMGDLDYAGEYSLQYWNFLNRISTGRKDDRFIRGGILILMLAMMEDVFDGSGDVITEHSSVANRAIDEFIPEDDGMIRLLMAVKHGLQLLAKGGRDNHFDTEVRWAYDAFVRRYFIEAISQ